MIERGKCYIAGDFGANWEGGDGGWLIMRLSTGNAVGCADTPEHLLAELPEFKDAQEVD